MRVGGLEGVFDCKSRNGQNVCRIYFKDNELGRFWIYLDQQCHLTLDVLRMNQEMDIWDLRGCR